MKQIEVVAKSKDGAELGKQMLDMPETLSEAISLEGGAEAGEAAVLKLYNQARKVNARNALARPVGTTKLSNAVEIFDKCVAAGLDRSQALNIAGISEADLLKFRPEVVAQ